MDGIADLGLSVNTDKFKLLSVGSKQSRYKQTIYIDNAIIENVDKYKYLGIIISRDGTNSCDIENAEKSFYSQFYCLYRKFSYIPSNILLYLFTTHCNSFYGCELWNQGNFSKKSFNSLAIAYHNALKKIFGISRGESNHFLCNTLGIDTFDHLINKKYINFLFNLNINLSPCFASFKTYFLKNSFFVKKLNEICDTKYGIKDILGNDRSAVFARLRFVQERESCSLPLFLRSQ